MAFILGKDISGESYDELRLAWKAYSEYLESIKDRLPKSAYDFATAPWHFFNPDKGFLDIDDPRIHMAPHDSWLEVATIAEPSTGERLQYRSLDIFVRLLGPYHDCHIELNYGQVKSYSMVAALDGSESGIRHGDWLSDDMRLSERGYVLHEIEWSNSSNWQIECKEFSYRWSPLEQS